MAKQKHDARAVIDSIPEIEGREFQRELFLEEGDIEPQSPVQTGARMLQVHIGTMSHDRRTFPRVFQRLVAASGMNENQLALSIGKTRGWIWQLTHGWRKNPSMECFLKVAHACGCRVLIEYPRRVK